jgi:hypothetical protein
MKFKGEIRGVNLDGTDLEGLRKVLRNWTGNSLNGKARLVRAFPLDSSLPGDGKDSVSGGFYKLIFEYFFQGLATCLFSRSSSAAQTYFLVSRGMITSSTKPRSAG